MIRLPAVDWTTAVPLFALVTLVFTWGRGLSVLGAVITGVFLAGGVLAAVHHAEVIAHRVGEPFGSLILAVAVTVIEVGLIVSLMASGGPETSSLARDTVFAAVMITCNGIVGLSLLVAALRRKVAVFNAEGTGGALATVATLAVLSLVLPKFTTSTPGPVFSAPQLASPRWPRSGCTDCSWSRRRSGTATTSCRSRPTAPSSPMTSTPSRPRPGRPW
ncbi:calcium:proton antiporter [Planomonospora algeriensis]